MTKNKKAASGKKTDVIWCEGINMTVAVDGALNKANWLWIEDFAARTWQAAANKAPCKIRIKTCTKNPDPYNDKTGSGNGPDYFVEVEIRREGR